MRSMDEKNKNKSADDIRRDRIRKAYFGGIEDNVKKQKEEIKKGEHGFLFSFFLGLLNVLIIIAVVVLVRTFLVSPFSIDGHSMDATFADGDLIIVDKISYRISDPGRGDVVVFYPPIDRYSSRKNFLCFLKTYTIGLVVKDRDVCRMRDFFVKRIIGIPGDTVEIRNGEVFITPKNGERVQARDDFLMEKNKGRTCFSPQCNSARDIRGSIVTVPEGHVYVLGDNRTGSYDSRKWETPFVPYENISGKVRLIFFPFSHIGLLESFNLLSSGS